MALVTVWHVIGTEVKRRGSTEPPPSSFPAFTQGTVKPLGIYDEQSGVGVRNVGPRIPTTPYNGDMTISAGQTVSGLEIFGKVTFTGQGVLRDCIVHGKVASSGVAGPFPNRVVDPLSGGPLTGIVGGTSDNLRGSLIEWCRLDAIGYESVWQDGIRGGNYTARYNEIWGAVDGCGMVQVGNGTFECNRIGRGYYSAWRDNSTGNALPGFPSSPADRTTHSDGIQIHQFTGWVIRGNYIGGSRSDVTSAQGLNYRDPRVAGDLAIIQRIDAAWEHRNAGIIINTTNPNTTGAIIDNNWLQGGGATVNISASSIDPMSAVHVRNNRIIRITSNAGFTIYRSTYHTGQVSGNVYDDTGAAVPISSFTPP